MPSWLLCCSDSRTGNKAASVFPDPVGATTMTSEPRRIAAIAAICIGLSCVIPAAARRSLDMDSTCLSVLFGGKAIQKVLPVIN